jgi:hypothetical protein
MAGGPEARSELQSRAGIAESCGKINAEYAFRAGGSNNDTSLEVRDPMSTLEIIVAAIVTIVVALLAEKYEGRVKLGLWITFVSLVVVLTGAQIIGKHRAEKAESAKDEATRSWQRQTSVMLDALGNRITSREEHETAVAVKRLLAKPPESKLPQLSLKGLFLSDFGPHVNCARWDDRSLTIGSRTHKFPDLTLTFTPQLCTDSNAGTKFLGFYVPRQDDDPDNASEKTVTLCKQLPYKFPDLVSMLETLTVEKPSTNGSTIRSDQLPLSPRVYIYHEDFISPPDLGDLVREYESQHLLVEFRGREYLATQELLRALNPKKQ